LLGKEEQGGSEPSNARASFQLQKMTPAPAAVGFFPRFHLGGKPCFHGAWFRA
jgi:hypothetical protein